MSSVAGPFAVVAIVLAVGGAFKLRDPGSAREMWRSLGAPFPDLLARVSGPVEVVVGLGALWFGTRAGALVVALAYVIFAAVTARLLRGGGTVSSCGCFGRLSAKPSTLHLGVNLVAAGVAIAAALAGGPGLRDVPVPWWGPGSTSTIGLSTDGMATSGLSSAVPATVPLTAVELLAWAGFVGLGAWMTIATMTALPAALAATRRGPVAPAVRNFEISEGSW